MPPTFSKQERQSTMYFQADDLNKRRLIRNADFLLWFAATFRRSPASFFRPIVVESDADMNQLWNQVILWTFRGKCVVSVDMEYIRVDGKAYNDYPAAAKQFLADPSFPSHPDYPLHIVRHILLGFPHGETVIINAARMSRKMRDDLISFLKSPNTVVCGFNFASDAFAFQLTFGDKPVPYTVYKRFSKEEKRNYQTSGILTGLRVFDLSNVLQALKRDDKGYCLSDWQRLGLIPEGEGLWHLAQSALCLDLVGNDVFCQRTINHFWNTDRLDAVQSRYAQIDAQTCVCIFMLCLRYNLVPQAKNLFAFYPHDLRQISDVDNLLNLCNHLHTDATKLKQAMYLEATSQIKFSQGDLTLRQQSCNKFCLAQVTNPEIDIQNGKVDYEANILPVLTKQRQIRPRKQSESSDDEIVERTKELPQTTKSLRIPFSLNNIFDFQEVLNVPYFVLATSPRSRQEAEIYLDEVVKRSKTLAHSKQGDQKGKFFYDVNWLLDNGSKSPALSRFLGHFPKDAVRNDCLNNFATSYPAFLNLTGFTKNDYKNPEVSYLQDARYLKNPHFNFNPFVLLKPLEAVQCPTLVAPPKIPPPKLPHSVSAELVSNTELPAAMSKLRCGSVSTSQPLGLGGQSSLNPTPAFSGLKPTADRREISGETSTATKVRAAIDATGSKLVENDVRMDVSDKLFTPIVSYCDSSSLIVSDNPKTVSSTLPRDFSFNNFDPGFVKQLISTNISLQTQNNQLRADLDNCRQQLNFYTKAHAELLTRYQQISNITSNFLPPLNQTGTVAQATLAPASDVIPANRVLNQSGSQPDSQGSHLSAATITLPSRHGFPFYRFNLDNTLIQDSSLSQKQTSDLKAAFHALRDSHGLTSSFCTIKRQWLGEQARLWLGPYGERSTMTMVQILLRWYYLVQSQPNALTSAMVSHADATAARVASDIASFLQVGELLSVTRNKAKNRLKRQHTEDDETDHGISRSAEDGEKRSRPPI